MLDIGTSCEDTLQVHPVSLDVNPHIKCSVYLVQSLLSSQSLIFKNLLKIYVWSIFKLHYTQKSLKIKSPIYNNTLYVSLPPSLPLSQKLLKKLAIYSLVVSDHSMPVTPLEQKKRMQRVNTIILFCTTDKL